MEKKLEECQRMAEEFVQMERRRMEERMLQQQQEVEMLRRQLQEIEVEMSHSRGENNDGTSFASRLLGVYGDEDPGMVKSMDLDMGDQESFVHEVKYVGVASQLSDSSLVVSNSVIGGQLYGHKVCLSTVFEKEEVEEEEGYQKERVEDEEVQKEVIEVRELLMCLVLQLTLVQRPLDNLEYRTFSHSMETIESFLNKLKLQLSRSDTMGRDRH